MKRRSPRRGPREPHYTFDGVAFLSVLAVVAVFVALQFRGTFVRSVDVVLLTPRSGLSLEPGARVLLHTPNTPDAIGRSGGSSATS